MMKWHAYTAITNNTCIYMVR